MSSPPCMAILCLSYLPISFMRVSCVMPDSSAISLLAACIEVSPSSMWPFGKDQTSLCCWTTRIWPFLLRTMPPEENVLSMIYAMKSFYYIYYAIIF